jgi:hypothetical protein
MVDLAGHRPPTLGNRAALALLAFCLIGGGCARSRQSIDSARDLFAAGDIHTARDTLTTLAESRGPFADPAALDLAMIELAAGEVTTAESRLRRLRDRFDALPKVAPVGEAVSLVTDDRARTFRPSGYEQVMIRAVLAVCSLAGDGSDAESYVMQAAMKQDELAALAGERGVLDAANVYQPIALAPYLRGMLREATHRDYDDAARSYRLVSTVRPQFAPAEADIARASGGTHSAPGHGVLYVIGCVGRGPVLQETTAPTTSTALSIASAVLNAETNKQDDGRVDGTVLPNIASVKIPEVVLPPCELAAIGAQIDGNWFGATQTLTDVGELAGRQTEAEMPWTLARAVIRRATKEATVAKVGDSMGLDGQAGSLFHFATATAWSGSEHADTRCWGLLPREIQVLRAELPAGSHQIQLHPLDSGGQSFGQAVARQVEIVDGRNHYLIAIAPDQVMYLAGS